MLPGWCAGSGFRILPSHLFPAQTNQILCGIPGKDAQIVRCQRVNIELILFLVPAAAVFDPLPHPEQVLCDIQNRAAQAGSQDKGFIICILPHRAAVLFCLQIQPVGPLPRQKVPFQHPFLIQHQQALPVRRKRQPRRDIPAFFQLYAAQQPAFPVIPVQLAAGAKGKPGALLIPGPAKDLSGLRRQFHQLFQFQLPLLPFQQTEHRGGLPPAGNPGAI